MLLAFLDRLIECLPHRAHTREWQDPHGPSRLAILPSFLFDERYYLSQVGELKFEEDEDAFSHYLLKGIPARKWPNPWFDPEYYCTQFPEDPGSRSNPLLHYLKTGAEQNAKTCARLPDLEVSEGRLTPLGEFIRRGKWRGNSDDGFGCHDSSCEVREELAGRNVVLDLDNRSMMLDGGRYLLTIAMFGYELGCQLHVRRNRAFQKSLPKLRFHKEIIDWLQPVDLKPEASYPPQSIVLADRQKPNNALENVKTWIYLLRAPIEQDDDAFCYKVPMHPSRYKFGTHQLLHSSRQTKRRFKIMFCGNSGILYRNPVLSMRFGKVPRNQLLRILQKSFTHRISYLKDHPNNLASGEIVLGLQRQVRIPGLYWLQWLSRAKFNICLPGAYFPMSHSLAECMAVGTIPILEYPEITDPPLENGINCIAFKGKEGFRSAIQQALEMDEDQIKAMRQKVTSYYDQHLSFAKFTEKLLTHNEPELSLKIPFEFPSFSD